MTNRSTESPWNPTSPVEVKAKEYEEEVLRWLKNAASALEDFKVTHRTKLRGRDGGKYEFDVVVEFTILGGARIVVLVECKRHNRPVEREKILALRAKLLEVGAHKAIMFSTSGFQRGALEYATAYEIATVSFIDGKSTYFTRAMSSPQQEPPPWLNLPRFAGTFMRIEEGNIHCHLVEDNYLGALVKWLGLPDLDKSTQTRD